MNAVHLLHHSYEVSGQEETKLIGVYSSATAAADAMERLRKQPGFRDRPNDFSIDEYEINRDHWCEGFVSLAVVLVPRAGALPPVGVVAEVLLDGTYRLEDDPREASLLFHGGQVVRCRPVSSDDSSLIVYEQA